MRKNVRRFTCVAIALVLGLNLFIAAQVRAQVLDQVPDSALMVIKVSNLQSVSQKFGKFCTDLQLVALQPQLADPLQALTDKMKISNGLDKNGEAAFAFLDPSVAGGDSDHSMVILFPVSDYKAFIGNFPDAKEDGGITQVKMPDDSDETYIANWGKYAAMSPSKAIAALKPTGVKVSGLAEKEMTTKDLVIWGNLPKLKVLAQPKLKEAHDQMLSEFDKNLSKDEKAQKYAPVLKAPMTQMINVADAGLRDATNATFSLNFGDAGINTALMAEFAPDSYAAGIIKSVQNSDQSLTVGVPAGKYLFFGGSVNAPEAGNKIIDDFTSPIMTELKTVDADQSAAVDKYLQNLKKFLAANKGQAMGMLAPSGALGQEPLIQFISVQSGDAATIKSTYIETLSDQQDVMKAFGSPQNVVKTTVTPNGKTVDGISFDTVTNQFDMNAAGPNAAQAQMAMTYLYGPNGMTINAGVVGDKVLVVAGASDQVISSAIASVKANEDSLGKLPGVTTVNANLPKSRVAAFYVPLDQLASTIGTYASGFGMPIQIQLPPDLPPIGATVATEGSSVRVDSYTPTDLIKALVAQGMQIFMQMQGGHQPGGPGGL